MEAKGLRVETEQSQSTRVWGFRTNRKKERKNGQGFRDLLPSFSQEFLCMCMGPVNNSLLRKF